MKAIVLFVIMSLVGACVDGPYLTTESQELCTAEDQESLSCPDFYYRIPYTGSYHTGHEASAGLPTPTPAVSCQSMGSGSRVCTASDWVSSTHWVETTCYFSAQAVGCGSFYCHYGSYPPPPGESNVECTEI